MITLYHAPRSSSSGILWLLEEMEGFLAETLSAHRYIVGDTFTAADVLVGGAVRFFRGTFFPDRRCYTDYIARLEEHPTFQRAQAKDNG